jgi:hypothetical protein
MSGFARSLKDAVESGELAFFQRALHRVQVLAPDHVVVVNDREALHAERRKMLDDLLELFSVACAHVVHVAVENAHWIGAGERREERHALLLDDRQRRARERRARIAEERKDPVLLDELACIRLGARHLIRVIERHELDPAPVHAARFVCLSEIGERPVPDVVTELGVGARERRRLPDHDARRVHPGGLRLHTAGEHARDKDERAAHCHCSFASRRGLCWRGFARVKVTRP